MASSSLRRVLFAFMLAEEEEEEQEGVIGTQDGFKYHHPYKDNERVDEQCVSSPSSSLGVTDPGGDEATTAVIKTEATPLKRYRRGSRCSYDYLQKGGLMAFYNLSDFNVHFGLTRTQAQDLFAELMPHYPYERGSKLPLENLVLSSLWVLSSQESYRIIADRFKTCKSVICSSLHTFCSLVSAKLGRHIRWPVGNIVRGTTRGFERLGFPGTIGAMDAFHVSISKPKDIEPSGFVRDSSLVYSTTLFVVCDDRYRFTYVSVGHDSTVSKFDVFSMCDISETIATDPSPLLPNYLYFDKWHPVHIVADGTFPLSEYIMTPYDKDLLKVRELEYNRQHSSVLSTVHKAVGVLKARYSRLKFLQMQHLAQCHAAIKTCCILHNIAVHPDDVHGVDPALPSPSHLNRASDVAGENKRRFITDSLL